MAIPTQATSGTEVLRRGGVNALSNTETLLKFDGGFTSPGNSSGAGVPTNHIVTLINIIFHNVSASDAEVIKLRVNTNSNDIYLLKAEALGIRETYVWDERIVLEGGDNLGIVATTSANIDVWYSYIEQSWV